MIEIRRILCPTDLSDVSRCAFDHATALARHYGSEIRVVHVVEPFRAISGGGLPYPSWTTLNPEARERLEAALCAMTEPAASSGLHVEEEILEGVAVHEILTEARSLPADMLVMGTHGRGGFERFLLGSVTEKVMRHAPCPVFTVPPPAGEPPPGGTPAYDRILCPLDFSAASDHALRYALSLAQEAGSELVVLHVLEWPVEGPPAVLPSWFDRGEHQRRLDEDARQRLREAVPEDAQAWCRVEQVVAQGKAWREIVRVANEKRSELVVMGVRGRSAVDLALFGSTAQHVVRAAGCPVMVVHTD